MTTTDIAIVGGGLAGGLTAYALSVKRPDLSIRLIEPAPVLGGNHVWSFFETDIAPEDRWIVEPFVSHRWQGYDVAFPAHRRTLDGVFHSIRSQDFDVKLRALLPTEAPVRAAAVEVTATRVALNDQTSIDAKGVIDARGGADFSKLEAGWQKFVGLELRTAKPHGVTRPMVMDASVEQIDGYRFVYVLPFAEDRLFVEDTYYSDGPEFDRKTIEARVLAYAAAHGWDVAAIVHSEEGALPVTMGGDFDAYWASGEGSAGRIGARAALFHATTGFSLPDAVRTAAMIARLPDLSGQVLADALEAHARAAWARGSFYRLLDRMLFRVAEPEKRYKVLERFYTLRPELIQRFYAGRTTVFDKMRILAGKPPVPFFKAFTVLREN
jgi:lycopene beta-cyclase